MTTPILYDSHMHTPLCKHARGNPEAYAAAAQKAGLKGIIITCHNPGPKGWSERIRMSLEQFPDYLEMVDSARAAWAGRVDVRLGLESDYIPGIEPFLEKLHEQADFHFILGSVHPQLPYYKDKFYRDDAHAFQKQYFDHLAQAAESGLYDCLSHPDLVKNVFSNAWEVASLMPHIERNLDRIAATGVAMELNTSGLHKRIREMNPGPEMLAAMAKRNIPVVLGSDSHEPGRVGADFVDALEMLETAGFAAVTVFAERQPTQIPIATAVSSLLAAQPVQRV